MPTSILNRSRLLVRCRPLPKRCSCARLACAKTITIREPDATTHFPPQYEDLMSERSVFCLKSSPRLKRRGEQGQAEAEQSDHGR